MACKSLRKRFKNNDMFGHSVVLNFNRQGETYKTSFGGLISIAIKIVLIGYVTLRFLKMVGLQDNQYGMNAMPSDFDSTGSKNFEEMNFLPLFQMQHTVTFQNLVFDMEEFSRYASIFWTTSSNDLDDNA